METTKNKEIVAAIVTGTTPPFLNIEITFILSDFFNNYLNNKNANNNYLYSISYFGQRTRMAGTLPSILHPIRLSRLRLWRGVYNFPISSCFSKSQNCDKSRQPAPCAVFGSGPNIEPLQLHQ